MKYKKVFPAGILTVGQRTFWLINPEPLSPASWQLEYQQRFEVVPFEPKKIYSNHLSIHSYARHIVCCDPVIEYRGSVEPIYVEDVDFHFPGNTDYPDYIEVEQEIK